MTRVAAELVAATSGLRFIVQSAAELLVTGVVILGIAVIAIIAFTIETRCAPWPVVWLRGGSRA